MRFPINDAALTLNDTREITAPIAVSAI